MPCDLLVFAPHPDDAEIHFGASIARATRLGRRVVVVDATRGEMGSRGSRAERDAEAAAAATVLGLSDRGNLDLPDGHVDDRDNAARLAVVEAIRRHQPRLILVNHVHTQHPDHRALARLVGDACKAAELHRLPGTELPAWRGARLAAYEAELPITPAALIACRECDWERKQQAVACYGSQLHQPGASGPDTSIAQPSFTRWIESRGRTWGHQARADYAEAISAIHSPLSTSDLARFGHEPDDP